MPDTRQFSDARVGEVLGRIGEPSVQPGLLAQQGQNRGIDSRLNVLQTRRTCPRKGHIIERPQNGMVISVVRLGHTPVLSTQLYGTTQVLAETRLQVSDQHLWLVPWPLEPLTLLVSWEQDELEHSVPHFTCRSECRPCADDGLQGLRRLLPDGVLEDHVVVRVEDGQ